MTTANIATCSSVSSKSPFHFQRTAKPIKKPIPIHNELQKRGFIGVSVFFTSPILLTSYAISAVLCVLSRSSSFSSHSPVGSALRRSSPAGSAAARRLPHRGRPIGMAEIDERQGQSSGINHIELRSLVLALWGLTERLSCLSRVGLLLLTLDHVLQQPDRLVVRKLRQKLLDPHWRIL